jgi:hypothetical protein
LSNTAVKACKRAYAETNNLAHIGDISTRI